MPLIIVATDFSDVAGNAVNYACNLALTQNAEVNIIHSFIVPVMFSDVPMPSSIMNDAQNDAEMQMNKMVETLSLSYPPLTIKGRVIYGNTVGVLDDYTGENKNPWLIVVGNSSAGERTTWPDSTLIDAFKTLKYPVLAVPFGVAFKPVKKICLAFDNKHAGNDEALNTVTGIARVLNAELHIVYAQPSVHDRDNNKDIDGDARELLSPANPHYHFIYEPTHVDQAIQDFNEQNNMDWLIMIPRKHSFFEGLFHKSHTKSVAHHSRIPILALHESV